MDTRDARWRMTLLVGAALASLSGPVLARQDHGDEPPRAAGADAAHGQDAAHARPAGQTGGSHAAETAHEPNILSGNLGNVLFTLVIFLGVVFILGRFAWGPLLNALQQREKFIRDSIEDARREREEADRLLARYREQIDRAREEATRIVEEGRRDGEAVRRRIHEEARTEADELIARARREIDLAAQAASRRLYDEAADLAILAASKVVARTLRPEDHRELVAQSLREMSARESPMN